MRGRFGLYDNSTHVGFSCCASGGFAFSTVCENALSWPKACVDGGLVAAQDAVAKKCWRWGEYQNLRRPTLVGSTVKAPKSVTLIARHKNHRRRICLRRLSDGVCAMSFVERALS